MQFIPLTDKTGFKSALRATLWLNTLPKAEWEKHPTVEIFRKHAQMHECNSLFHLERILNRQLLFR